MPDPAPSVAPQLNASHVIAAGGGTAMLAGVLVWLTHWPIQPLDPATALDLAGLLTGILGGGGVAWVNRMPSAPAAAPPPPPPPSLGA